jgi:hypothetical protein
MKPYPMCKNRDLWKRFDAAAALPGRQVKVVWIRGRQEVHDARSEEEVLKIIGNIAADHSTDDYQHARAMWKHYAAPVAKVQRLLLDVCRLTIDDARVRVREANGDDNPDGPSGPNGPRGSDGDAALRQLQGDLDNPEDPRSWGVEWPTTWRSEAIRLPDASVATRKMISFGRLFP